MNELIQEWQDAISCASEWDAHGLKWSGRVIAAGEALRRDYQLAIERADREARLAVALRQKLEEVAGPDVACNIGIRGGGGESPAAKTWNGEIQWLMTGRSRS